MKARVHISSVCGINSYSFRVHLDGARMMMAPDLALFHTASLDLFPAYVHDCDGGWPPLHDLPHPKGLIRA